MPQVPQFNRETTLNGTAKPYQNYNLNENTFGVSIAKSGQNIANALTHSAFALDRINQQIEETKGIEFNNAIEKWKQDNLFDKENGYFAKTGKEASGKSGDLVKGYDDFVQNWKSENKLSKRNQERLNAIATNKRSAILNGVTTHDLNQTKEWAKTEGAIGVNNAIINAVSERNNPEGIKVQIANIKQISRWQGETAGLDADSIQALEMDNVSRAYCSILDSKIQEGDTSAKDFFAEHKNEINSAQHSKYIGQIKNLNDKYESRNLANQIIAGSKTEQEAIKKAEAIKDVNMSDSVISRVRQHYSQEDHFKHQAEKEALNRFYNKAIQVQQNGGQLSYDDIPENLDPQVKLSLMNYVNKNGETSNDEEYWDYLNNMSVNNAQEFAKVDLNKYRGFLSDGEYKSFLKRQQAIQDGGYYTTLKDDNERIIEGMKACGIEGPRKHKDRQAVIYSEIRSLVREFEARKGRSINDTELQNITNSLGYKDANGVVMYKALEKGMAEKNGFIRDVINDFAYYQSKHNGQLPSDEEKMRIINKRVNSVIVKQNNELQTSLTQPRQAKEGDVWQGHIITSTFGPRKSPTQGATSDHMGIDLAYKNNEIFPAYESGTVVAVGKNNSLGNYVDIKGLDGSIHRYGHANAILVQKGDQVNAGDKIGRAGSTGISTGPHVHYAKLVNGKFVNPLGNNSPQIAQNNKGWAF